MAGAAADLTHVTPVDAAEAAFVARIAEHLGCARAAAPPVLSGEGYSNWVYRVEIGPRALALKIAKPHRAAFAPDEHRKEVWCAAAARSVGLPTPEVLSHGLFEDRSYQLQGFAAGRAPRADEHEAVWRAMGGWARRIHAIPVAGWGNRLAGDGVFDGSWAAHLAYNIEALGEDDPLLAMGVLDAATSADLRRRFQELAAKPFRIGLCHADLAVFNVLVEAPGQLTLIDWGCAFAGPAPHYEINEIIRDERASAVELKAFIDGYGLTGAAFAEVRADLPDLLALRDVDTLRWGLEHRRDEVGTLARRARRAIARLS